MMRLGAVFVCLQLATAVHTDQHELVAHLKLRNLQSFERTFWAIANPDHESYLQFLSRDDVATAIGAAEEDLRAAQDWLVNLGAEPSSLRISALKDTVTATFASHESEQGLRTSLQALSSQKPAAVDFVLRRDAATAETLGAIHSRHKVDAGTQVSYKVKYIKQAYGIAEDLMASNNATLQMVWGPGTFGYSAMDLRDFQESQCPKLNMEKVKFDTENHGKSGDNFGEGNLDTKMIAAFGLNVMTLVSNTNTSASTEEGDGFGQALLDFVTELSSREIVPHVLSMSLGSLSAYSCDLLCSEAVKQGHTHDECRSFLENQRQVCMFLSQDQVNRINTAFQILGTRGVSVFMASGDGGSHFSFEEFDDSSSIGRTLNKISCEYQMPVAPTNSPYIIGVGGEKWGFRGSDYPAAWYGSGSGFSWQFEQPEHQKATVQAYLLKDGIPPAASFNAKGAAYPDMAAVSSMGTSQAAPIAAGIFSMLIDHRLNAGLPPLGFVAPRLWKVAQAFPGEAFKDITEGNSKTSCDNGFPCTEGWDPVTGWGRPVWDGMLKHFGSDNTLTLV